MPKRVTQLLHYFVPHPLSDLYPTLQSYLEKFPVQCDWREKSRWVLDQPPELLQMVRLLETLPNRSPDWKSKFELCGGFFARNKSLPAPFYILRFGFFSDPSNPFGPSTRAIEVLWNHSQSAEIQSALNHEVPLKFVSENTGATHRRIVDYYLFGNQLWTLGAEESAVSEEEMRLLFLDAVDKDRSKFERLRNKFSGGSGASIQMRREPVPEEVRIFVWRRDEGKCVKCGSNERLEFDHIIPVIKGGSNTERNIQLLCEPCNRSKGDRL